MKVLLQVAAVIVHLRRTCCQDRISPTQVSVGSHSILDSNENNTMGAAIFEANTICGTLIQGEKLQYDSFQVNGFVFPYTNCKGVNVDSSGC